MVFHNMHAIEHTYVSLLADVARLTGFSEIRGSYGGLQWTLNDAPKLEKQVLASIETGRELDLDAFPKPLRRLAGASVKDALSLRFLRQLLLFSYKASVPHNEATVIRSYQGFLDTNNLVHAFGHGLSNALPQDHDRVRRHCQSVLYKVRFGAIKPHHGPGAVTTRKGQWLHRYTQIEKVYPQSDWFYLYFNRDHLAESEDCTDVDAIEAKLVAVPKDSRGPRLICVHPAEAVWIQEGIWSEMERAIALQRYLGVPWPRGSIHFRDQTVNGRIALSASRSRKFATIDLKDASDRISNVLVEQLFGCYYAPFACCRAQTIRIPALGTFPETVVQVGSYAPMGNATTFPVQSLLFWAICVSSMQRRRFHQPGAAFVFGDDIIVTTECVEDIIDTLEAFGLCVNKEKSFWRGSFRESCGVDAFNGVNVTPIRWKLSLDANTATDLLSLADLGMRLRIQGFSEAASTAYSILRQRMRHLYGKPVFFTNNRSHGGIAEFAERDTSVWQDAKWHRDYQWYHSPIWTLQQAPVREPSPGWYQVLESLCSLERSGQSTRRSDDVIRRQRLVRTWVPVQ